MTEYSRIAKGHFTSTGAAKAVNLPFTPDSIKLWNYSSFATPAQYGIPTAYWDADMGQGTGVYSVFNATPVLSTGVLTASGFSTFSAGQLLQFGPKIQIVSATAANPIVFTVAANTYSVGDIVQFEGLYQSSTTGMPQICGMPFVVSAVSATTFSVVWPGAGSNYTALSGSPAGAYVRKILYPFLYEPGVAFIEALSLGSTTTVTTTAPHNFVTGQQIAFRIPPLWGTVELNSLPNTGTPGSPKYYYVTSVTSNTQFVCNAVTSTATAFNTNQTVASVPGLDFPQVLAVGDVNTGGILYSGGNLYPSPSFPTFSGGVPTINGPAIQGAFVNNTSSGFIIGTGALANGSLVGANGNVIYWEAALHDISVS